MKELARKIAETPKEKNRIFLEWHERVVQSGGKEKGQMGFLLYAIAMERGEMPKSIQINISNSKVATLNVGDYVGSIESVLSTLAESDVKHREIAQALKELTEGVLNDSELDAVAKRDATEVLADIAEEANLAPERRSSGRLKSLLVGFPVIIAVAANLTKLWDSWVPAVRTFFGI